jgi:hypothetical protein
MAWRDPVRRLQSSNLQDHLRHQRDRMPKSSDPKIHQGPWLAPDRVIGREVVLFEMYINKIKYAKLARLQMTC